MAANVEKMAYTFVKGSKKDEYTVPWHGEGQPLDPGATPHEILVAGGIDFTVEKVKQYITMGNDPTPVFSGQYALVRSTQPVGTDDPAARILTNCGEIFQPTQNEEFAEFFENFCKSAGRNLVEMTTAGSLDGGRICFMAAKINDAKSLFNGKDVIQPYLTMVNQHKYGYSGIVYTTEVRPVCQNTVQAGMRGHKDLSVKFSHRKKFNADEIAKILGMARERHAEFSQLADLLAKRKFQKQQLNKFFGWVFPHAEAEARKAGKLSRTAEKALEIMDTQPGADLGAGTWWQPFNAVTFMVDHVNGNDAATRQKRAWFGPGKETKLFAGDLAKNFALGTEDKFMKKELEKA